MARSKIKKPKSPELMAKLERENKRRLAKLEAREKSPITPHDPQIAGLTAALSGITDPAHLGLIGAFACGLALGTSAKK